MRCGRRLFGIMIACLAVHVGGALDFGSAGHVVRAAEGGDLPAALQAIQRLGKEAEGHAAAIAAWPRIASAEAAELPTILAGMNDQNPLANNWIRAAVDAICERTLQAGQPLPAAQLDAYLSDTTHSPRSRRLAFEWLTQVDAGREPGGLRSC